MYNIKLDQPKNTMFLTVDGFLSEQQVKECVSAILSGVRSLADGFYIVNDITNMKPLTPEGVQEMKHLQTELAKSGVAKIIRVTDSAIAKMQVNRVHREVGGYEVVEASSLDEAISLIGS